MEIFSWTLDPDIAAVMIAAMVVGLVLTTKNFCEGVSRRAWCTRAKALQTKKVLVSLFEKRYVEGVSRT